MGAGNVKLVYARWYGLPDLPFRVLAYMALVSLDGDEAPSYWGGWEALALAAGRLVPERNDGDKDVIKVRRAALKAVATASKVLLARGAVRIKTPAAPGRNATYELIFTAGSVHPQREPSGGGGGGNGSRSPDTTVHAHPTNGSRSPAQTVHAHGEPEEYEEQVRTQPRNEPVDLDPAVTGPRAREAATDSDCDVGEVESAAQPIGCPSHGPAFKPGRRPDGKPACPLCRRGAPASPNRIAPVIPINRHAREAS